MSDEDGFFARWSRRKVQQREGVAPDATPAVAKDTAPAAARASIPPTPAPQVASPPPQTADPSALPAVAREPALPAPTLADVAQLTPQSDFSRFVAAGVDAGVQRAALRKLFSDPHFNVMDGLDTYIGDYNTPDPIPDAMLRRLRQSKTLGIFDVPEPAAGAAAGATAADAGAADAMGATAAPAHESAHESAAENAPETSPDGAPAPTLSQSAAAESGDRPPEPRPDEDTALRLQPDDAADAADAGAHRPGPRA
jgi:hypothetical protein